MRKEFSRDPSLSFTTKTHETICARYGVQPSGCTDPGRLKPELQTRSAKNHEEFSISGKISVEKLV